MVVVLAFIFLRGTLGICGVAVLGIFSCGVAVNKISACGVAVFLNLTVCDVCVLKSAVFGETKLSAVSQKGGNFIYPMMLRG